MSKQAMREEKRLKQTTVEKVRDFFNLGKVKKIFGVSSELFEAIYPLLEKPNTTNMLKSVFVVGKVVVDNLELWPDDYFDDNWECPYPTDFNKIIYDALSAKPHRMIRTSDEANVIYIVQIDDVKFGYVYNTKTNVHNSVYVEVDKVEKAKEILKNELWKMMKDDNIVLRHVRRPGNNDSNISLEVDDAFCPMPSKRASEYASYLKKCIDSGVARSVMLYGPPGTGKSTMARTIVNNLGLKSFRIRVEDIADLETSAIFEAINIFEPDAVILDDFDRTSGQAALLETLEFFQRHVKLVIATVNNKNMLDDAILRPGRFDELVQIKKMDDDVVRSVLGKENEAYYDLLKDWPIAFIQEYVKRLRFMTPDEAEASVKELAQRVKRLSKYDDDEDENDLSVFDRENKTDEKLVLGKQTSTRKEGPLEDLLKEMKIQHKRGSKRKRKSL